MSDMNVIMFDDPSFIKAHTNHHQQLSKSTFIFRNSTGPPFAALYYIDADELDGFNNGLQTIPVTPLLLPRSALSRPKDFPVAVCNGLMLFAPLHEKNKNRYWINWNRGGVWEIWNPLTHERLELPRLNTNSSEKLLGIGLGYDCGSNDYKVVAIEVQRKKQTPSQTHVYSLRSDSWRTIANYPTGRDFFWGGQDVQCGVFLNGALHWISKDVIIVFDVGTEDYLQLLALPVKKGYSESMHLDVVSERLFLSCSLEDPKDRREGRCWFFDLWVMNDYGAKDYSWTKLFTLDRTSYVLRPIAYMRKKRRVLLQGDKEFVWFDEKSKTIKSFKIHGISDSNYSSLVCVGSLFRLHDSCGRVAPASSNRRRTRNLKIAAAHTKRLTFCVRDYDKCYPSHGKCHRSRPNWYYCSSGSAKRTKDCGTSSFDPDDGDSVVTLPPDICRDIFLRFPAKSVIQFRAVCKAWRAVIDDPCFAKAHTNKQPVSNILLRNSTGPPFYPLYSFDLDELDLKKALQTIIVTPHEFTSGTSRSFPCLPVHGCNGLMLITDQDENLKLWNPLTDEHLELPQVPKKNLKRVLTRAIGLGYDQATDDYKVVAIQRERGENYKLYGTHVYSLSADSWKRIGDRPRDVHWSKGPGVFLRGSLHWFSSSSGEFIKIIALDLTTESYRRQLKGPLLGRGRTDLVDEKRCLDVLDDCLIMTDFGESNEYGYQCHYDIWVMKDYGSEDSWTKLFSIADKAWRKCLRPKHLRPLTYLKNNTQILLQNESWFYLFDVESDSVTKVICIHGLTQQLTSQIFPGSIFRLHDNCGVGGKRRKRKRIKSMKRPPPDTELYFCVRDGGPYYYLQDSSQDDSDTPDYDSHDICYTVDSNWYYSSSENDHQD